VLRSNYRITNVIYKKDGLKDDGTHWLMDSADGVNWEGEEVTSIQKRTGRFLVLVSR